MCTYFAQKAILKRVKSDRLRHSLYSISLLFKKSCLNISTICALNCGSSTS